MDFVDLLSDSTSEVQSENEASTSSKSSTLKCMAEKMEIAVDKIAMQRNLDKSIVLDYLPPIDLCVFGRSGIGKSTLIKAITNLDLPASPQIDHVTHVLTEATTTIDALTFRFWDTKGIDNWLDIAYIENMFNEMNERKIKPLFVIYCATANGRVDSDIVAGILKRLRNENILICYVITNIYAGSLQQLEQQIEGGRKIMDHVFETHPNSERKLCYEYENPCAINDASSVRRKQGILIGVNSCSFTNVMGTMPPFNVHELMDFLAGNLDDEDFTKFVALTMANRGFWCRVTDAMKTRVQRVSTTLNIWKLKTEQFFRALFRLN